MTIGDITGRSTRTAQFGERWWLRPSSKHRARQTDRPTKTKMMMQVFVCMNIYVVTIVIK